MAAKKGTKAAHSFFDESSWLHQPSGSFDGGACLNGHMSHWKEGNSCSYRWQGLQQAEEHPQPYNSHPNVKCHLGGSGIGWAAVESIAKGASGEILTAGVIKLFTRVTKKSKKLETLKQKVTARNFTNGFAPYGNQVHHVLPNAVLAEGVAEVTSSNADLIKDIGDGLLKEMYNINYKVNMLILPTAKIESRRTGLPTHCGSHPTYSCTVKAGVKLALKAYAGVADQGEGHPPADFEKLKRELETLSESTYADVIAYGQANIKDQQAVGVNAVPSSVVSYFPH